MKHGQSPSKTISAMRHTAGEAMKIVTSRSHSDARTQGLLDKLGECECVNMGSALKLCLVAEGAAHFYPRQGTTMEWDTAAAHAVVSAAGGVVHDREGKEETVLPKIIKGLNE